MARYVLVWSMAFALVAGAAASPPCLALHMPAAAATSADDGHASHRAHAGGGHHDRQTMTPADHPAPPADDHACQKCCSMCTVPSVLPSEPDSIARLAASPVEFFRGHEDWSSSTTPVDPGIPKRSA